MMKIKLPFLLACFLLVHANSIAADYYVSVTGNDGNNGSINSPWKTIQKAFGTVPANAGHVINIGAGTYSVTTLLTPPAGVIITGAGTELTMIKSPANKILSLDNTSNITLQNLSMDGTGQDPNIPGHGLPVAGADMITIYYSNNIKVLNVNLYNGAGKGMDITYSKDIIVDGGYYKEAGGRGTTNGDAVASGIGRSENVVFKNITVEDDQAQAFRGWSDQVNVKVLNCVFKGTTNSSWNGGGSGYLGIEFWGADKITGLEVANCFIRGALSLATNSDGIYSNNRIHHNEMTQNYGIEMSMSHITIDHNFIHNTGYAFANFSGGGKYVDQSFHHNVIYNTGGPSILIHEVSSIDGLKCYNNTVITDDGSNRYVYVEGTLTNADFSNNIFVSRVGAALNTYGNPVSNNLFQNSPAVGANSVTGNPMVVNANEIDVTGFALNSGSPAINKGKIIAGITDDVTDGKPDIGAFEFGSTPWVVGPQKNNVTPRSAYNNSPQIIPGKVEAEFYDLGGNGIAYFDTDNVNEDGALRTDGVDIGNNPTAEPGNHVSYIKNGEWVEYTVNVLNSSPFEVRLRASSASTIPGQLKLIIDGVDASGLVNIPVTNNWNNYADVVIPRVNISAGSHVVRFEFVTGNFNFNYADFKYILPLTYGNGGKPGNGTPWIISSTQSTKLEFENYNQGGEGIGYHDDSDLNEGTSNYRAGDKVDLDGFGTAGVNIGYENQGEWLDYTVNIPTAGDYDFTVNAACGMPNGCGSFKFQSGTNAGNIVDLPGTNMTAPSTTDWQNFKQISKTKIPLKSGVQILRLYIEASGLTLDWFQLSKTGTITGLENSDEIKINLTATPLPFTESTVIKSESNKLISSIAVFNLEGVELFTKSNLQSTSVEFGNQLSSGMYFVAVKSGNMTEVIKIIKN